MVKIVLGSILLLATVALYIWGIPEEGRPSRLGNIRALATLLPIAVTVLGVAGIVLIAQAFFP